MSGDGLPLIEFDVPGLIRRVRRVCDLSQADLALRLGVAQSTVARWETGAVEPSLSMFRRVLALADCDLQVRDADQVEVAPMRADAVRGADGRRCPAHLDVVLFRSAPPAQSRHVDRHWCVPGRVGRDWRRREREGAVPGDHPFACEVAAYVEELRLRGEVGVRQQRRWMAAQRLARGEVEPVCGCVDECFVEAYCVSACECRCDWPDDLAA